MNLVSLGQQAYRTAVTDLDAAARRLTTRGPDPDSVVDLKVAERQAELAAKVIDVGFEVNDSLLDILA